MKNLTFAIFFSALLSLIGFTAADVQAAASPRVINGSDAAANEAPWMVALVYSKYLYDDHGIGQRPESTQYCGGTLVDSRHVLTAAHCVADGFGQFPPDLFNVYIGGKKLSEFSKEEPLEAEAIIVHPGYSPLVGLENDLALIRLKNEVKSPTLPIASAEEFVKVKSGTILSLFGYGYNKVEFPKATLPNTLQKGEVPLIDDATCYEMYGRDYKPDTMLCAGKLSSSADKVDGVDSCYGDSGGPLVANINGTMKQVGIVSFGGALCANEVTTGVYTELPSFYTWAISQPVAPPFPITSPTIVGAATLGSIAHCEVPLYEGDPVENFQFNWYLSPKPKAIKPTVIPFANQQDFYIDRGIGQFLYCSVTASNAGGSFSGFPSASVGQITDPEGPALGLLSKNCSRGTCKIKLYASDPSGVIAVTGELQKCSKGNTKCKPAARSLISAVRVDGIESSTAAEWSFNLKKVRKGLTLVVNANDSFGNPTQVPLFVKLDGRNSNSKK